MDFDAFGSRIKRLRKERGWTQEELAARASLTDRTIRNVEKRAHTATVCTLDKLAIAFEIHLKNLLFPDDC